LSSKISGCTRFPSRNLSDGMVGWLNPVVADDCVARSWGHAAKISRSMLSGIDGASTVG